MTFEECFEIVLDIEGRGVVTNDPDDNGGLTKWGISLRAHPELSEDGIRSLSKAQAKEIYKADYWGSIKATSFPLKTRLAIFDMAVNHGVSRASKLVQKAANADGAKLMLDGEIGPITLAAVKAIAPVEFLVLLSMERLAFYQAADDFEKFGKGWQRRIFKVALLSN